MCRPPDPYSWICCSTVCANPSVDGYCRTINSGRSHCRHCGRARCLDRTVPPVTIAGEAQPPPRIDRVLTVQDWLREATGTGFECAVCAAQLLPVTCSVCGERMSPGAFHFTTAPSPDGPVRHSHCDACGAAAWRSRREESAPPPARDETD